MDSCKKHPCPDCSFCQLCSESRCMACRDQRKKPRKMTLQEQIALFEKTNCMCRFPEEPIFYNKHEEKE